jgi:hypothetical protein
VTAAGKGVPQARVEGDDERQRGATRGAERDRQNCEILSLVRVDQIEPARQPQRGHRGRGAVELAAPRDGKPEATHDRSRAQLLDPCGARRTVGDDLLLDSKRGKRPRQMGSVVLHPPDRVKAHTTPAQRRWRRLEH